MIHRFFCLIILVCFVTALKAQLADGTIAPNWTLMDINGTEHHLYDYLNDGKTVFLDFSATWNASCWTYHNKGALNKLYDLNGPSGTAEVMVLMIECDWNTDVTDLNGSGPNTYGNWINNTSYPIIDDYSLIVPYDIGTYPTIYKVCPNKRIEHIGMLCYEDLLKSLEECEGPSGQNNVSILSYDGWHGSFCDEVTFTPAVTIQNEGSAILTSCRIKMKQDNVPVLSQEWHGELKPQQSIVFELPAMTLESATTLSFLVEAPNYQQDEFPADNQIDDIRFRAPKARQTVRMTFHTDIWPDENEWFLYNSEDSVLYQSGSTPLEPDTEYHYTFELEDGACYTFEMSDKYGDGLLHGSVGPGQDIFGNLVLESDAGVLWNSPAIGFGISIPFQVDEDAVGVAQFSAGGQISLSPNPASEWLQLNFNGQQSNAAQLIISNSLGAQVFQQSFSAQTGHQQFQLPVHQLPAGFYVLSLLIDDQLQSLPFVINR